MPLEQAPVFTTRAAPAAAGDLAAGRRSNIAIYVFGSLGGFLFGYDTGVIAGALLFIRQEFALRPFQQGLVVSSLMFGALLGALTSGALCHRFGERKLLISAGAVFTFGAVAAAASPDEPALIAARFVLGLAVGTASVQVPLYLSELAPTRIRGALTTLNQIMIGLGILSAYVISFVFASSGAWRIMVGLAVIPSVLLMIGMFFQPESPRWLMKRGRDTEAIAVLRSIRSEAEAVHEFHEIASVSEKPHMTLRAAVRTRAMWPVLAAAAGLAIFQQIVGVNTIVYYAPTILPGGRVYGEIRNFYHARPQPYGQRGDDHLGEAGRSRRPPPAADRGCARHGRGHGDARLGLLGSDTLHALRPLHRPWRDDALQDQLFFELGTRRLGHVARDHAVAGAGTGDGRRELSELAVQLLRLAALPALARRRCRGRVHTFRNLRRPRLHLRRHGPAGDDAAESRDDRGRAGVPLIISRCSE